MVGRAVRRWPLEYRGTDHPSRICCARDPSSSLRHSCPALRCRLSNLLEFRVAHRVERLHDRAISAIRYVAKCVAAALRGTGCSPPGVRADSDSSTAWRQIRNGHFLTAWTQALLHHSLLAYKRRTTARCTARLNFSYCTARLTPVLRCITLSCRWDLVLTVAYDANIRAYDTKTGAARHCWPNERQCQFTCLDVCLEFDEVGDNKRGG